MPMPQDLLDSPQPPVSRDEVHSELQTILRSPGFERSERLQRFLRFICELTLNGDAHRINEYLIGSEVFQRGSNYSPSEDSIVRRQAHTLRQKLQEYYAHEGLHDAIRIELPVGRYVPTFRRVAEPVPQPEPVLPAAPVTLPVLPETPRLDPEIVTAKPKWRLAALMGAVFVGGLLCGFVWPEQRNAPAPQQLSASALEIWGDWIAGKTDAVICFSNPMTTVIKHYRNPLPPDSVPKRFRAGGEESELFRRIFRTGPGGYFYYTPVVNQTKMGEAIAGVHLSSLLARAGVNVRSTQSRFLSWEDLRKDNLILLGHNEANQWLEPVLKDRPFRLANTEEGTPRAIINGRPAAGEPGEYRISYSREKTDADQEYALVSMLPGVDGRHPLLLISGLNAQATQAATEYLTSDPGLQELTAALRKAAPNHSGKWHFQAVLRTEVYDKVPTRVTLLAVRVL